MDQSGYREMEERISIRDTGRKLKKYGSTSRHMIRNDNLIKHIVTKSDTLAGIALKYGVTTEQIRRVNKLYASDSLFLREYLMVPIPKDLNSHQNNDGFGNHDLTGANSSQIPSSTSGSSSTNDDSPIDNFLAKMDSSIETVKKDIKRSQDQSLFQSDEDWCLQRRHDARNRHSHPHSSSSYNSIDPTISDQFRATSEDNVHNLPPAVVMHGKKLKSSLQKLQQQQDEIFQL